MWLDNEVILTKSICSEVDTLRSVGYCVGEYTECVSRCRLKTSNDKSQSIIACYIDVPDLHSPSQDKELVATDDSVAIVYPR